VSAPGIISSSAALSWPHGTEFSDSYLKLAAFTFLSFLLSHDNLRFPYFFDDITFAILQRLADVDNRKSLIAMRMWWELHDPSHVLMFDIPATAHTLSHTVFWRVRTEAFDQLVSAVFLSVCIKYDHPQ